MAESLQEYKLTSKDQEMLSRKTHTILLITLSVFLFSLTGCETMQKAGGSGGQVDPRLTENEDVKFFSRSGWVACAGGAVVGALACAVLKDDNRTECMIAAGIAGCGVAMGANYYLDHQRGQYATKEKRLEAELADVRKDNTRLNNLSKTAKEVIASDRKTLAQLQRDIAAGKQDMTQANQELSNIDANIASLKNTLADLRKRQAQWVDVAQKERNAGANTKQLDQEIDKMKQQVASLQGELDMLYQQRSAIRLA